MSAKDIANRVAVIEMILERAKEKYPEAPRIISDNGPQG